METHEERINILLEQVQPAPYENNYYTASEIYKVVSLYLAEYERAKKYSTPQKVMDANL